MSDNNSLINIKDEINNNISNSNLSNDILKDSSLELLNLSHIQSLPEVSKIDDTSKAFDESSDNILEQLFNNFEIPNKNKSKCMHKSNQNINVNGNNSNNNVISLDNTSSDIDISTKQKRKVMDDD